METKVCSKCGNELSVVNFSKNKGKKDGLQCHCIECRKRGYRDNVNAITKQKKQYYQANAESISKRKKQYYRDNTEVFAKRMKQYRRDNKETIAEQKKKHYQENKCDIAKYYLDNKDAIGGQKRQYYHDNKIKMAEYHKQYCKEHPDKTRAMCQRRRARKTNLPNTLTTPQWNSTKEHFNNKCCYCGTDSPLVQEHFLALSKGGEYTHNNIVPSCAYCNLSKHAKNFFDWYPKFKYYSKERENVILDYLGYRNGIQQLVLL